LIEALVVMAIIAVLAAILIPAIQGVRSRMMQAKSASNLRQLHNLSMQYANAHGGRLPPAAQLAESGGFAGSNFYLVLSGAGYIDLRPFGESGGDHYLFNPLLVEARRSQIRDSTAATYAVNFWATGGMQQEGGGTQRASATRGLNVNVEAPSKMALFMDGRWNGTTWPVQIGNWPKGDNIPDFSFPPGDVGEETPSQSTQVVFMDGHVESVERKDFPTDLDTPFWKGREV